LVGWWGGDRPLPAFLNTTYIKDAPMLWIRPSGTVIETNDLPATIAKAEELGWEEAEFEDSDDDTDEDEE
jgi:hypothetical protein